MYSRVCLESVLINRAHTHKKSNDEYPAKKPGQPCVQKNNRKTKDTNADAAAIFAESVQMSE